MERRYAKASMKLLNKNTTAVEILGRPIVGKFSWYNIFGIGSSCTDDVATLNIAVIGPKASGNYRFEAAREDEVEWSLVKAVLTIPSSNENPENVINLLPNGEVLTSEILKTKTETGKEKEIRNK